VEATRQDKRSIVRRRTQQLVYLELGKENGGVMLNLSEHGCGFQAITPVKCGETRFGFQINGGRRIAGDAEVVWADDAGVMGGLRFLNLPAEAHREIRLWLEETNAPVEHGFAPAAAAAFEGGARRSRAMGAEEASAPIANTRVAVEEPPVPPAWANLRAGTYPPIDDGRYGSPYLGDHHAAFGNPHRKSAAVWRGIALVTTLVALAVLVIMYQRDVGTSLIWLGETLAGKAKASAVVPDKQPASTSPSPAADSNADSPAANVAAEKNAASQGPDDSGLSHGKELPTAARSDAPAGVPPAASSATGDRPESVLERQGALQKAEPVWNEGDSVESLWSAVQSGSVSAEVSLAERFARGQGVSKNCDQAKVLMKAAADRGNREARLRLYEMETGGCR
jgi:hypothetical protein